MALRFLFGMLSSGMHDRHNHSDSGRTIEKAEGVDHYIEVIYNDQAAVKFHIGMLSISLIVGLAYSAYVVYTWWMEKDVFLGYIRNLVIALVCRTFFTVLFDGVILLGSLFNAGGGNTLSAFEQIFLNLVLGFWLSLTIYMHARVQRNFKSEPTLRLYQYGIPVIAFFFAFIWIMVLQQHNPIPQVTWWVILNPVTQWIVNSANLLFLLIQLGLVADMCRMMAITKSSLDNDSVSLLWKVAGIFGALVIIFWFQFGFSLGLYRPTQSYLYFFYFIDGMECTLVCVCLYFFNKWVVALLINNKSITPEESVIAPAQSHNEGLLNGGRGIVTIGSMLTSREYGLGHHPEEDAKDVVYSNVVEPHRLQKTLELYKRFNVIQKQVTVIEGEEFYDCQIPVEYEMAPPHGLVTHQKIEENGGLKNGRMSELTQKRNAFYSSKYLILDSKEGDIPKYLETRPSLSSMSEKDCQKEERTSRIDIPASLDVTELVKKWLNDSSEINQKNKKPTSAEQKEPKVPGMEIPESKLTKSAAVDGQDTLLHQDRPPEDGFFRKEGKEVGKEKIEIPGSSETSSHLQIDNQIESVGEAVQEKIDKDILESSQKMELKTEHDFSISKKNEPTTVAEEMNKHVPIPVANERVVGQSPSDSKLIEKPKEPNMEVTPAPTAVDEPDAEVAPKQPSPFLTYSELVEFRSKRDSSSTDDKPTSTKHSLSESIFSTIDSLLNVGGSFFNSLTRFSQGENESHPTQGVLKCEPELQHAEKLKEIQEKQTPTVFTPDLDLRYDEVKASNLPRFQTSPTEPTTVGDDNFHFESKPIREGESTTEIKNHGLEKAELDQQTAINEPFNAKPNQERRVVPVSDNLISSIAPRDEAELPSEFSMDKKLPSEFSVGRKPIQTPLQDEPSNDIRSQDLRNALDSSTSVFERLDRLCNDLLNDLTSNLPEKSDSPDYWIERQSKRIEKPFEDQRSNEEIIPELRDSDFKRVSSSSSEFSIERLGEPIQNLQRDKFSNEISSELRGKAELTKEKRLSSSSFEFSTELCSKPVQKSLQLNALLRDSREKSDPELTTRRLSSSSSSSSEFTVVKYCTKVKEDSDKIQNHLVPLHPGRKNEQLL